MNCKCALEVKVKLSLLKSAAGVWRLDEVIPPKRQEGAVYKNMPSLYLLPLVDPAPQYDFPRNKEMEYRRLNAVLTDTQ